MWIGIGAAVLLAMILCMTFLIHVTGKFYVVSRLARDSKKRKTLISFGIIIVVMIALGIILSAINSIIVIIHLGLIWGICELISYVILKVTGCKSKYYFAGVVAVALTVVYMSWGYYGAHHLVATRYEITVDKAIDNDLTIVQMTDCHMGTVFDAKQLAEYIEGINEENPDIVCITGDFVDDSTTCEEMEQSCKALAKLNTTKGVYFVYGNHDPGYSSKEKRGYDKDDITRCLEENGVCVLEDESVRIDDNIVVVGRRDRSDEKRKEIDHFNGVWDADDFVIVLDHQPCDYDKYEDIKVDIVLSGHTHGGQFIPVLRAGEWMGVNDATYGIEKRNSTNYIVSSGMGDWEVQFKTGCLAEYVVINVKK